MTEWRTYDQAGQFAELTTSGPTGVIVRSEDEGAVQEDGKSGKEGGKAGAASGAIKRKDTGVAPADPRLSSHP